MPPVKGFWGLGYEAVPGLTSKSQPIVRRRRPCRRKELQYDLLNSYIFLQLKRAG
jgi:hypothetical protein